MVGLFKNIMCEICNIQALEPNFRVDVFITKNFGSIQKTSAKKLYSKLKEYRENLEISFIEVDAIIEDGKHIESIIAKQFLYGEEE